MSLKIFLVAASALALNHAVVSAAEPAASNTLLAAASDGSMAGGQANPGGGHPGGGGGGGHPGGGGGGGHPGGGGGGGHPGGGGGGGHPGGGGGGGHPVGPGGGGHPVGPGGGGHPVGPGGGGHPVGPGGGGHPVGPGGGGHPVGPGGGGHPGGGFPGGWHPPAGHEGDYHPVSGGHGGFVGHGGGTAPTSHWDGVQHGFDHMGDFRHDAHAEAFVSRCGDEWHDHYAGVFADRWAFYGHCHDEYYPFYSTYWGPRFWFWGWGWRSDVIVVDDYFWNPAFFWFYADDSDWDDGYYSTWYGPAYGQYPHLHDHFRRPRVFYPTQAFAELTVGVSSWAIDQQLEFRTALTDLVQTLDTQLTQQLGTQVTLDEGSIEVDHYQLLTSSVVFDGSVTFNNQGYPFRAYVDLVNPANTTVFVTTTEVATPTPAQAATLTTLNAKVTNAGGILETPTETATTPGGDTGVAPGHITGTPATGSAPQHVTTTTPDTGVVPQH